MSTDDKIFGLNNIGYRTQVTIYEWRKKKAMSYLQVMSLIDSELFDVDDDDDRHQLWDTDNYLSS